jgi:hypothetical protein
MEAASWRSRLYLAPAVHEKGRSQTKTIQEHEMLKGIGILALAAGAGFAAGPVRTFTGVVTDTMCGADHAMMNVKPESKCVRDCVKSDPSKFKYALYDGKNVYILSDQQAPEKYAAQKVSVRGTLDPKTSTIHVDSIAPAK